MTKFLIIRFSSIGDIIQCMGIIGGIRERFADVEIHWITRKDMVGPCRWMAGLIKSERLTRRPDLPGC